MNDDAEARLKLPGLWIDHPDRDWACLAHMLLDHVVEQVNEATLVLSLYFRATQLASPHTADGLPLQSLYARSFVYALDAIGQVLRALLTYDQLSCSTRAECQRFLAAFGSLHELRNSFQHLEDRLRGLGRNNRPLPKSLTILGCFRNGCFGGTTATGAYVEVELSYSVLSEVCQILEDLVWSFNWLGRGNQRVQRGGLGA